MALLSFRLFFGGLVLRSLLPWHVFFLLDLTGGENPLLLLPPSSGFEAFLVNVERKTRLDFSDCQPLPCCLLGERKKKQKEMRR